MVNFFGSGFGSIFSVFGSVTGSSSSLTSSPLSFFFCLIDSRFLSRNSFKI